MEPEALEAEIEAASKGLIGRSCFFLQVSLSHKGGGCRVFHRLYRGVGNRQGR